MRYSSNSTNDEQLLHEVQLAVNEHLKGYMKGKQWNLETLSFHLKLTPSLMQSLYCKDNNFTVRRLIDLAVKTDTKLVISFEPITQKQ